MLRRFDILKCVRSLLTLCIVLAAGVSPAKTTIEESKPVWPSSPQKPRITYVESFQRPADAGVKKSSLSRLAQWLTGSDKGKGALQKPFGIALDENGNLCWTDTGANTVFYLDRAQKKWQQWEHLGKLRFASPVAIAKRKGTFFVVDSALRSLIAFSARGKVLFQVTNRLERPSGLAIVNDHLMVADSQRHCIVLFDLDGNYVSEFGKRGVANGEFNFPTHLTGDTEGNVFVTDSMNSRVQVFDPKGRYKRSIGSIGGSTGHFSRPKGVAVDSFGHAYIVDALFDNVQIFDATGRFLLNFGEAGTKAGEFWLPNGIAISRANEIFVTDSYNHRIQVFKYIGGQ